jgi:UDPglucose 6-dehydrogenase
MLLAAGAAVQGYDPQAMRAVADEIPDLVLCQTPYDTARGADAVLLATEWNEFKSLDFDLIRDNMRGNVILDGRNIWNPEDMHEMGFIYFGIGIPNPGN